MPPEYLDREVYGDIRPGSWRNENNNCLAPMTKLGSNNFSRDARQIHGDFKDFFNSIQGSVPWQWNMVSSTSNPFDEI